MILIQNKFLKIGFFFWVVSLWIDEWEYVHKSKFNYK
jgi:hypothetical protein